MALVVGVGACSFDTSVIFEATEDPAAGADAGFDQPEPDADNGGGGGGGTPDAGGTEPDAEPPIPEGTLLSTLVPDDSIELDGELDPAWQGATFIEYQIQDAEQLISSQDYSPDASLRFASVYDSDSVYFYFEVTDDLLVDDSENLYNDDSIELYIDGVNNCDGPYGDDDHWLVIGAAGTYQSLGPESIAPTGTIRTTDTGYVIEIALDRAEIGSGIFAGEVGFNVGLNDDDGLGGTGVDAYGLWFNPATTACPDCCGDDSPDAYAWCDTTRMGRMRVLP